MLKLIITRVQTLIADQTFIDDLFVQYTPVRTTLFEAMKQDRRLRDLTRKHDKRIKTHWARNADRVFANSWTEQRVRHFFARWEAWAELYPRLGDELWSQATEYLDNNI